VPEFSLNEVGEHEFFFSFKKKKTAPPMLTGGPVINPAIV
jgi:hypothetical protein